MQPGQMNWLLSFPQVRTDCLCGRSQGRRERISHRNTYRNGISIPRSECPQRELLEFSRKLILRGSVELGIDSKNVLALCAGAVWRSAASHQSHRAYTIERHVQILA